MDVGEEEEEEEEWDGWVGGGLQSRIGLVARSDGVLTQSH